MTRKFVKVTSTINCVTQSDAPVYRLYCNGELMSERTWLWGNSRVAETLQISAMPGQYNLRYEIVEPHSARIVIGPLKVEVGPAHVVNEQIFRIV